MKASVFVVRPVYAIKEKRLTSAQFFQDQAENQAPF
jgi:hypothetical protein